MTCGLQRRVRTGRDQSGTLLELREYRPSSEDERQAHQDDRNRVREFEWRWKREHGALTA